MTGIISDVHSSSLPKGQLASNSDFSKIRVSLTGTEINSKQFKNAKMNINQLPRNELLAGITNA